MKAALLFSMLGLALAGELMADSPAPTGGLPGFVPGSCPGEQVLNQTNEPGVRIHINAPASLSAGRPVHLVIYGCPNGNTIEHTMGRKIGPGEDWHFDIQHIAAQTRFLRARLTNESLVVACLENNLKSWPAWRRKHGDAAIPRILRGIRRHFDGFRQRLTLTGHSGGGSFTFGYLNQVGAIPAEVERIAFLDSNYAYESTLHGEKFFCWLKKQPASHLIVLAYHDNVALLNGKTFVSAEGGTWGRSHQMLRDLQERKERPCAAEAGRKAPGQPSAGRPAAIALDEKLSDEWKNYSGLGGRVRFFLRQNPEKKIFHTVQVERNGFIHALLCGTPLENDGYTYFGERAYSGHIEPMAAPSAIAPPSGNR